MKSFNIILLITIMTTAMSAQHSDILSGRAGQVDFVSEAPLELIKAQSNSLSGVINVSDNRFAFQVDINSFEGFNSPLQQIHFQENYLESGKFPHATFEGKILDDNVLTTKGSHSVRAKGLFKIHGVAQERIIRGSVDVYEDHIVVLVKFKVQLEDHDIRIPRIVCQKISEEIDVSLRIEMK